jgi:hypothetical protein
MTLAQSTVLQATELYCRVAKLMRFRRLIANTRVSNLRAWFCGVRRVCSAFALIHFCYSHTLHTLHTLHTHTHAHTRHKPDHYITLFLNNITHYGKDKWHATEVLAELNFQNDKEELWHSNSIFCCYIPASR